MIPNTNGQKKGSFIILRLEKEKKQKKIIIYINTSNNYKYLYFPMYNKYIFSIIIMISNLSPFYHKAKGFTNSLITYVS